MVTISQVIRDALKSVENPNTCPSSRLLVIARALGDKHKLKITSSKIAKIRFTLRKLLGELTKSKILDYEKRMRKTINYNTPKIVNNSNSDIDSFLDKLRNAKEFTKEVGGLDIALNLLNTLKELMR